MKNTTNTPKKKEPAADLIDIFKKTKQHESGKIELDNLDWARLVYNDKKEVVVENEHGTQFPVSDLSTGEIRVFEYLFKCS